MTLAETTVSNAIRYSMRRFCFANIIIAGPICSGKKSLAELIAEYGDIYNVESSTTIFYQDDYLKEYDKLEDTMFGVKEIDSKSAYHTKKFVNDVRTFYEVGHVSVKVYTRNCYAGEPRESMSQKKNSAYILETKLQRRTNIFVGPHAIDLLVPNTRNIASGLSCDGNEDYVAPYKIPEAICIYLNTNEYVCMERRRGRVPMLSDAFYDSRLAREYERYVASKIESEIAIQKEMADIVINCGQFARL